IQPYVLDRVIYWYSVVILRAICVYDLVVVGSGPAGSTCARKAALARLDTVIVETETHPREKICGGAIGP
ncbi:MAG: FAD-dependent oxidoreductase, partial [Promethearchaeia archaeon]